MPEQRHVRRKNTFPTSWKRESKTIRERIRATGLSILIADRAAYHAKIGFVCATRTEFSNKWQFGELDPIWIDQEI